LLEPRSSHAVVDVGIRPEITVNPRFLIIATLLALLSAQSTIADAQRSRTQSDRRTELFDKDSSRQNAAPAVRVRDVEDQSPIKLLIDKRKDLKLTDAQLAQLKETEGKLKNKNAPLLNAIDSLARDLRSSSSGSSDDARERARAARMGLMSAMGQVRANYDDSAKEALAAFDADQQSKAGELLDKQRQDTDKYVQERVGGVGGRRGSD
jgi:hypothetical protein